jgi:hypothetical protein
VDGRRPCTHSEIAVGLAWFAVVVAEVPRVHAVTARVTAGPPGTASRLQLLVRVGDADQRLTEGDVAEILAGRPGRITAAEHDGQEGTLLRDYPVQLTTDPI